ncbi:hypothetical protein PILCRDRAFT_813044 [Piloderma croceum F 1598]|uniref:G-patch domain-containing protein n=1 Tax=Piloderma croceum (strain F 1598) TaxID=765440 RepID=A0A0C3GER0_PILCF|nr:hypothetical protein PILCRDRAFT_813044 [Piloderma croceum F 1598]
MPLDGHSYLVAQGWSGKGTGLRQGAISRPLAIPQKKTLSGLGKDRDEAFPFWDHLFTAAASTIKIKVTSDDEDSDNSQSSSAVTIKRTTTGILSNRRPVSGTAANSGSSTPDSETPRLSLIANAKREAAKRGLYSRFFRGPVLGPSEGNLSDGPSGSGSSSGKSEAPAEVKSKVPQSPNRQSVEDSEDRKKERWRKNESKQVDKRTTEKDRAREGIFVEQEEEAMARKARKRDKRAAKLKAPEDNYTQGEDNRRKRKGKRKRESTKSEPATAVEETFADTRDNSLAYRCHNVDPANGDPMKEQTDTLDQHIDIAKLNVTRKKKRKRTETS